MMTYGRLTKLINWMFVVVIVSYACLSDNSNERNSRVMNMMNSEIKASLNTTKRMSVDNSTKHLLFKLDSTLLYIIMRAEKDNANIYYNYDLPIYFTYNYSLENIGKITDPLIEYANDNKSNVLDYNNININSEKELDNLFMRQKFSILEFYLYISNIRNQIRLKELDVKPSNP